MSKKYLRSFLVVFLAGLILAGCATGPRAESTPGISAAENQIYVSYMNYVYKLDPANGKSVWRYPEKSSVKQVFYAPALIDGDSIYVGDFANDFLKINTAQTPTVDWTFTGAKGWFQGKAAKDRDLIIVPNTDRNIYAISVDNNLVWTHRGRSWQILSLRSNETSKIRLHACAIAFTAAQLALSCAKLCPQSALRTLKSPRLMWSMRSALWTRLLPRVLSTRTTPHAASLV